MGDVSMLRWETLTKRAFDELDRERTVVMVTCSPIEVHGPHLPMGADALQGEGLAERVLRFLPERHAARTFLKLPFIYTCADVVAQPGSLQFPPGTTVRVLTDLGNTLARQGFKDVIVSNFHGGPRHFLAVEKACSRVNRKHGTRMVSLFSLMISRLTEGTAELGDVLGHLPGVTKDDFDGDTHGGLVETSQLLALHPERIDPEYKNLQRSTVGTWLEAQERERKSRSGRGNPFQLPKPLRSLAAGFHYFTQNTYSGAPALASAELGEQILDLLAEKSAGAVSELFDGEIGPEDCHSPIWKLRFIFLNPWMIRLADAVLGHRSPIA